MKRFIILALLIIGIATIPSCIKEKSLESSSSNTSTGSLQSDVNEDCLPKTIAGVYEAGTTLGASNFITVDVNVTGAGTYTITTDTVNGYYFRGTGTFGSTGAQTIKLTGIGSPVAAGTDDFLVSYGGTSCFISVTVLPDGSAGPAVFSLQGAGGTCTNATLAGSYILSTPLNASNKVTLSVTVTTIGTYSVTTNTANGISFSGTGVFSTTGAQTIELTGTGTPAASTATTLSVTVGTGTCTFQVPISGPAAFTIDCTSADVLGTYEEGTALDASNTVDLDVNVTTAGAYSISTTAVHGMVFSGSGTLATGPQTIRLTGSGTPDNDGIFMVTVSFGASTCDFIVSVDPGSGGNIAWSFKEGTLNFEGVEDGSQLSTVGAFTVFAYIGTSTADDDLILAISDLAGGIQNNETYNTNATTTNAATFLFEGSQTYTADNTTLGVNMVFKVTSHNTTAKTIEGTFSGTCKNAANVTKTITAGTFKGTYQ
jgi:hypothetical protein